MPTLLDEMWAKVEWRPVEPGPEDVEVPGIPFVTHEGALTIGDASLRVYQLGDGRPAIEADDLWALAREAGHGSGT